MGLALEDCKEVETMGERVFKRLDCDSLKATQQLKNLVAAIENGDAEMTAGVLSTLVEDLIGEFDDNGEVDVFKMNIISDLRDKHRW
jgi:hypothetical protein